MTLVSASCTTRKQVISTAAGGLRPRGTMARRNASPARFASCSTCHRNASSSPSSSSSGGGGGRGRTRQRGGEAPAQFKLSGTLPPPLLGGRLWGGQDPPP